MKILIITSNHPKDAIGGSELQAHLIAKELNALEQDITFCAVLSKYEASEEEEGLEFVSFDCSQRFFLILYKFFKFLRNLRPDIIYVRGEYSFWWINLISKLLKIPILYHVSSIMRCKYISWNEYMKWEKDVFWLKSLKRMIVLNFYIFNTRFADAIICQTEDQRALIKKGLKRNAILIRNGHPVPLFLPKKSDKTFNVIWIGKYWKNPEIFANLVKRYSDTPNISFAMVGIFPNDTAKSYKQLEGQISNFKFIGELSNGEVNRMLEKSHVLVNTSDYEGFSNTFIEAWMRGVPVLSRRLNPDGLLTEKRIGFQSGTDDQLERDVRKLFYNKNLFTEYSSNAYEYVCKYHDIKQTSKRLMELCQEVLNNNLDNFN